MQEHFRSASTPHPTQCKRRPHPLAHLLDTGVVADEGEFAEREGLHNTFVSDYLRLTILAPDFVNAAPPGTLLDLLRDGIPTCRPEQ
ncbi:Uncharacterized protein pbN1_32700 [Aromatoleum bremense]|nr:Uncharacterized protein pbN1_32700 [Aromatoleum bremense]